MLTIFKWFAALAAGAVLLLFAAFCWLERSVSITPTPAQERSALYRDLREAQRRESRLGQDLSVVAGRSLPTGLPVHLAQATLAGAGFRCAGAAPQRCSLLLSRSLVGRTSVGIVVWYVNDEVREVRARLDGVFL